MPQVVSLCRTKPNSTCVSQRERLNPSGGQCLSPLTQTHQAVSAVGRAALAQS